MIPVIHEVISERQWGGDYKTLRTTAEALVYSAAEYCCAAWSNSTHVKKLDTTLNESIRLISGCVRYIPITNLSTVAGLPSAHIRGEAATLRTARKASHPSSMLYEICSKIRPNQRLKSRKPFVRTAQSLLHAEDRSTDAFLSMRWSE